MSSGDRYPRRLIEVDLPIKRISAHARREKNVRHGHISTLHIWWARRPLAACRAVVCAALWLDPADELCPESYRQIAREHMGKWARNHLRLLGEESAKRFLAISHAPATLQDSGVLRQALLDFIADYASWDNANDPAYMATSRALTQAAHEALGGAKGGRPLVFDPFAGGGAIPIEALRVGADAFASDLNPIPVLLNKTVLEYIPKYGQRLADAFRREGELIKREAEKDLAEFYPRDTDGGTPIAYLWARTIKCEGPGCGAEIPLVGRATIAQRGMRGGVGIALTDGKKRGTIDVHLVEGRALGEARATCKGFVATCPRSDCDYSTPKKSVQRQLSSQHGGADSARLLVVLTTGPRGRAYRVASDKDLTAVSTAKEHLAKRLAKAQMEGVSCVPDEPIPPKTAHRAVGSQLPLYGFSSWGDLFTSRQKLSLLVLQDAARRAHERLLAEGDEAFARAVFLLLAFAVDKQADYLSSLCRWVTKGEFIAGTLAGEKKLPMMSDFAEANPVGPGSGSWDNHIEWIGRFVEREALALQHAGTACEASAESCPLPADSAAAMITDPPYYDSVPYADLSDFFFVWLKRTLGGSEAFSGLTVTPKEREMTVNHPHSEAERARYEALLTGAFAKGRDITAPSGIAVIVFAHKSTSGWEALLEAIIKSGWVVHASWPIDTERGSRLNAINTASLNSSVHIVCRPRENPDGSLRIDAVGNWRDVLQELPQRIHKWMPMLAEEGVVGADAIFACLGPALEVFSRYARVERASGEAVGLKEYLEQVWAAVAHEALSLIFDEADATGLEEDARLTAMWLWTLSARWNGPGTGVSGGDDDEGDEEGNSARTTAPVGFTLDFDAARKIAQGLGAHLEALRHVVEIKGDQARLLSVAERTRYLFGKDEAQPAPPRRSKQPEQLVLFEELVAAEKEAGWGDVGLPPVGETTLNRIHQAMILFAAGRGEALKGFLVAGGVGRDGRFWKLAQSLSALYPRGSDEKRWVDGVLARKKGLGFG